jgi:acetolactate synthase-1/2/3 large subunit
LDCAEQDSESSPIVPDRGVPGNSVISEIAAALETSHSPVLFVGQGAGEAPDLVKKLAERIQAVVVSTRSGRGILPENHPRALVFDTSEQGRHSLQRLLDRSDLVLALGCKFTHNGSFGFKLRIPQEKLIHVDSSEAVLGANYPARTLVRADCAAFLGNLLATLKNGYTSKPRWTRTEIEEFRIQPRPNGDNTEPAIQGFSTPSTQTFFSQLRDALPPETCLVTDSGRHQVLATRYFQVLAPRGLLLPTDFQSMGFGLPAAIGAKLAAPERPVVAIIGDGGFAMCGLELATAVRENIPLTLIVFNDEALGQIRLQQLASFGEDYATNLRTPDLELFAESIGARYIRLRSDSMDSLRAAILSDAVSLVEVNVANRLSIQAVRMKGILRRKARGRLFQRARDFLKR